MWFLGSGASAAAGIPTALHMVWEIKQQLYISQRRVSFYSGLMETSKSTVGRGFLIGSGRNRHEVV
jgi:hypothetical protein